MGRRRAAVTPPWATDPQYQAFESDIVAHPDDDAPRLILADWLDDQADEATAARAEFIRAQVELANDALPPARRRELTDRQNALLKLYRRAWLGSLAEVVTEVVWQRGFPQRLKLGVRQFMDNADELFRQAPILHLQLLRVSQTKLSIEEVAASPHFGRLRGLSLAASSIGDDKVAALVGQANLENLESLELPGAGIGRKTMRAIAKARLPRLRVLNLNNNNLADNVGVLCTGQVPFHLRDLDLGNSWLQLDDCRHLCGWPGLRELERLVLAGNRLGTAGGALLAASTVLGGLRALDLSFCEIGAKGIRAIAEAGTFPKLEELNLTSNHIRPSGFAGLLKGGHLDNLRALRWAANELGDGSMAKLAEWPGLAKHSKLDLGNNNLTHAGVEALCRSAHLGSLKWLNLSYNRLTDDGVRALAGCDLLTNLERLDVAMCGLTDASASLILTSPTFANLQELTFAGNHLATNLRQVAARFRHPAAAW